MSARHAHIVAAVLLSAAAGNAVAQSWPTKPIRLVVGFTAGGATDATARMVAQQLGPMLGQNVTVENRTGASGAIATERVATSPPDGYNLLMMTAADALLPSLRQKLPYNLEKDFATVSLVVIAPFVLVTHPSVPAKSAKELISLAKSQPGKMNYGSFGAGSSAHLMGELFKQMGGLDIVHVPYKGAAESSVAVVSGQIDMSFVAVGTARPLIDAGRMKAIGMTTARRSSLLPGVPTLDEGGLPGYDRTGWFGVVAPAATPRDIINRLNGAIAKAVGTAEMKKLLDGHGLEPQGNSPEEFAAYLKRELDRNAKLVSAIGLKPE